MNDIENKLAAARTRLILDKPFLGALTLRLPLKAADASWCNTTATDARALYYNPDFIRALSVRETEFVLAHEALHCALQHFARRQHRIKHRWDVACDLAVNPLLVADGLTPPPGALFLPDFEGMTAEEIYPLIDENNDDAPMDRHVYDDEREQRKPQEPRGGKGERNPSPDDGGDAPQTKPDDTHTGGRDAQRSAPAPLSAEERVALSVQWQQRLAGAAQQAMQAGKLGGAMARLVEHLLQPQLPWRMLLAHYMSVCARDDYSYARPSRREGAAILPSLRSAQVELVVALDTSGSVAREELGAFLAEVEAIKGQLRARVTLHACDATLAADGPWVCEPWEPLTPPPTLAGGGGTRFTPVFDWVARQDRAPDLLLYFTDADGEFPATPPQYPVLWLVKGRRRVPWGQRIQLN